MLELIRCPSEELTIERIQRDQITGIEGLISHLRGWLTQKETIERYRTQNNYFVRQRKLPFERVVVGLLQGTKMPLQQRMTKVFKELGAVQDIASASAFCQARQKVRPEVFQALAREITDFFYQEYKAIGLVKHWQGHRILSVDGSYFNLPDTPETRAQFSIQRNQLPDHESVQALTSYLYDVLNEVLVNAAIGPIQGEKHFLFEHHLHYWHPDDLVIYDRGYADYSVIALHVLMGIPFVIRCPLSQSFKAVEEFVASDLTEVQVRLQVTRRQKAFVRANGLPWAVQVRLVKVVLPDGSLEVLITSLLDQSRYPAESFGWLYNQRWGVETYIDRLKNLLDAERFSSKNLTGILQDFFVVGALTTLESVLSQAEDLTLQMTSPRTSQKHIYKVNKAVAYHVLGEYLVTLFLDMRRPVSEVLSEVQRLIQQARIPIRPGRSFKRKKVSSRQQARYLRYKKRIWA